MFSRSGFRCGAVCGIYFGNGNELRVFAWWADHSHENGYSQEEFTAGIMKYAAHMESQEPDLEAERQSLGENADARIEAITVDSENEPIIEEDPLEEGEVRPGADGSASCPFCDTRSKLPEGKTPPFRFRCPSCSKIVRVVE